MSPHPLCQRGRLRNIGPAAIAVRSSCATVRECLDLIPNGSPDASGEGLLAADLPLYCEHCGKPYPWARDRLLLQPVDEQILIEMHSVSQTESRAAQQALQSVMSWGLAAAVIFAGVLVNLGKDVGTDRVLAYKLGALVAPVLVLAIGVNWLNELGRMLRAGHIGRQIEVRVSRRTSAAEELDDVGACAGPLRAGPRARWQVRLGIGYLLVAAVALGLTLGAQLWAFFFWSPSASPLPPLSEAWVSVPRALFVLQIVVLLAWGYRVWKLSPRCLAVCPSGRLGVQLNGGELPYPPSEDQP